MKKYESKNEKKMKKPEEKCNFSFFGKLQFSSFFFFFFFLFFSFFFHFFIIFFYHFIIFHHFSSIPPLEAKMIKKNYKKMKKTGGKLQFFIFRKIFAPLEAKMMKHDKKNLKK